MMDALRNPCRLWLTVGGWLMLAATGVAQPAATQTAPEAEPDSAGGALPGLRQPGDDVLTPLPDSVPAPDPQRQEALAWYMDALAAQKEGNFSAALQSLQKATAADPNSAPPVKAQALLLMGLGRMVEAEEAARKAARLDPDDYETRMRLAVLLLARNDATGAAEYLEEALASKQLKSNTPEFVQLHTLRGRLALEMQNSALAAESYGVLLQALERPEDFGLDFRQHDALMSDQNTGYQAIGTILLQLGRTEQAIQAFQAQARVNNDKPGDYHLALAQALFRADRLEEAEQNLNTYFATDRRSQAALQLLTELYAATDRSAETVPRIQQLAEETPDAGVVQLFLGGLYLQQGDIQAARKLYEQVIEDTGDADAYLGLLRVDVLSGDADALLDTMQKALRARIQVQELAPLGTEIAGDREFAEAVVQACLKRVQSDSTQLFPEVTFLCSAIAGELELAEQESQLLQATLERNPGQLLGIRSLEQLGVNQLTNDQYQDAAANFRKLLAIPGLPQARRVMALYRLSFAESFNGNHDDAIAAVKAALEASPQNSELTYQLGWVQVQADKFAEAEASLRSAIQLASGDTNTVNRARLLLGGLMAQQERWTDSVQVYTELIEDPATDAEMARRGRMALSNAYVQQGDIAAGQRILEEVLETNPDDPGVNNDLGYLYADQGIKLEQAERMIRLAVAAEPENPAYLDSLGWVLHRLGKNEEALEALQQANSDPDYRDSTIMEHLGDVRKALGQTEAATQIWQEALQVEQESAKPDPAAVDRLKTKLSETTAATADK